MRHLLLCREYPPAPSGGIGTYALCMSRLLAESGDIVHVIGQLWEGAEETREEHCNGRLIIHRIPYDSWKSPLKGRPNPALAKGTPRDLFGTEFHAQSFSWQAGLLAEKLVAEEGIDLLEAQDYEAPLYFFQLRRALGIGSRRSPPCLIHLHSPTEFIARHNGWKLASPKVLVAKRLEDYSIAAADALLCPSRFVARQAEAHYGMARGSVRIIPYPIGEMSELERDRNTWEQGTICYVGRLEPRKGVLEWIEAAVLTARDYPGVRFEFIGSNALGPNRISGEEALQRLIPRGLKPQFVFRAEQKRAALGSFLRKARIAVVPSRWENFPYSCIEAMGSGLPVIATREGGMAEMVRDGRTGWLANKPGRAALREALQRALESPWTILSEMGREAALDIRRLCDNKKILEANLEFRRRLVDQKASRSLAIPANLPWSKRPISGADEKKTAKEDLRCGVAVIVNAGGGGRLLEKCIGSIESQTQRPVTVVILHNRWALIRSASALHRAQHAGWQLIRNDGPTFPGNSTWSQTILAAKPGPIGLVFLPSSSELMPEFIATCEAVLKRCPEVGVVSCWTTRSGKAWIKPCPSFPYQWLSNEAAPFSAIRVEALKETFDSQNDVRSPDADWKLVTSLMAAGWAAVTVPEVLGEVHAGVPRLPVNPVRPQNELYAAIRESFPQLASREFEDIQSLLRTGPKSRCGVVISEQEWFENASYALRHPVRTALWFLKQLRCTYLTRLFCVNVRREPDSEDARSRVSTQ